MTDTFYPLEFHPFANLFPLIEGPDFEALVEDIRAHGLREPIVLLDNQILDGRNRYRALVRLFATGEVLGDGWGLSSGEALPRARIVPGEDPCDFIFAEFYEEGDGNPLAYVLSKNLNRRHLNESQRAMVAAKLETLRHGGARGEGALAAEADLPGIVAGGGQDANLHLEAPPAIDRKSAADALHVSPRSVASAAKVRDHGAPELQHAVEAGQVAVSAAADIAGLPVEDQREIVARGESQILKAAKEINASKRERRRAERFSAIADIARASAPLPKDRKYPVIYADPPWRFDSGFGDRSIENHYPTMSVDEICALPVRDLAHDDAVLFMWVTVPHLESAFMVLRAWGFAYKSSAMWDKEESGTGYWFFNQHEILIVATRGAFPAPEGVVKARSVYRERKGKHSAKPDYYYGLIERMTPGLPRVELFSRGSPPGWDAWGNQAGAQESITQESQAKATEGNAGMAEGTDDVLVRQSTAGEGLRVGAADAVQPATSEVMDVTAGETAHHSRDDDLDIPAFLRHKSAAEQAEVAS